MTGTIRRATILLVVAPMLTVPTTFALAKSMDGGPTVTVPAPPGDSSATAAEVQGVVVVGQTSGHAGSDAQSAHADALDVLGHRVAGGDQSGNGSNSGQLAGTGDTPVGDAEVAPWSAGVTGDSQDTRAMAEAALLHVNLKSIAEIWVLHSQSSANWSYDHASGSSQSDGAEVNAGGGALDVKVLHSETNTDGQSKSDLLVVNGNEVGSNSDANGMCAINADPVVKLGCLNASGGNGSGAGNATSSGASVADVTAGSGAVSGGIGDVGASGGTSGPQQVSPGPGEPGLGNPEGGTGAPDFGSGLPHTNGPNAATGLPFTGADSSRTAAIAVALTALGGAMTAFGRRRRSLV